MYAIDDFSITAHAQPPVADGNGTATLVNAGADVLSGKDIFFRNSGSQSVTITVAGVSTGALTSVSIDVPASWTGLVLGNVSLGGAGFGSANAAVVSNTITVTGAAVTNTDVGTITITGLTTPNPTASSDNGNYLFTVKTAKASGTLTAISGSPSSYVVIPIANLKDNTVGVPNDLNSVVAVEGTVIDSTSMDPSGTEIHLQESSNGVRLFYLSSNLGLVQGNKYVAKGTVVNANGRTTIEPPNATSVVANGVGTMPTPTPITLATLLANAESYEGTLVTVQNVSKVSGTWPTVGVNSTNFLITDDASVSQTQLFVDKETNIDGIAEPTFPKDVRGVFSQFASAPYNTGYEILLRGQNDIGTAGTLPVQLSSFTAAADLRGATLTWKTASEVDNAGWEVERRAIGDLRVSSVDYLKLGFVQGAGTSTSTREYTFTDLSLFDNRQSTIVNRYAYRLKQIDRSGSFSYSHEAEVEIGAVAKTFQLSEAYPNPFNPATTIEFSLAAPGLASLKVYNLLGQEVATLFNGAAEAGRLYQSTWDASSVPSGMYFARLESGSSASMKKLMLVK